ncbi:hypothetical protein Sjap_012516 [Stephania japonica]|uniref:Uncharacterized protein n=1 Tax=Stephania japonica TaxID=461633 RepID=A0AAP0IW81_9MAGN
MPTLAQSSTVSSTLEMPAHIPQTTQMEHPSSSTSSLVLQSWRNPVQIGGSNCLNPRNSVSQNRSRSLPVNHRSNLVSSTKCPDR